MDDTFKTAIKSFLLGSISTAVEFTLFVMLQYSALIKYTNINFNFGPFNYSVEEGGLCTFLSMAISYLIGLVVNYFVQRKFAFNANGFTSKKSFYLYVISSLFVYSVVLYIPSVIGGTINKTFGILLGPTISKALSNFIGFFIQFPINKFVIFKKTH